MKLKIAYIIFLILVCTTGTIAQVLKGKIADTETKEPLAFVNIVVNKKNQGVSTNLDGFFEITPTMKVEFLKISYIGYEELIIQGEEVKARIAEPILLQKKNIELGEVTILPGINPAHRIIENVYKNRNLNNPEKLNSFSFTSYNKMIVELLLPHDSVLKRKQKEDSITFKKVINLLNSQFAYISETASEKFFIAPDNHYEKVI